MSIRYNKKGFTLVEMLIAVSIFSVVATLAASLFSTFANNQKRTKVSQELLNNAQYALEIISREVKNNEIIAFGSQQCQGLDPKYTQCLLFARENGETAAFIYDATARELAYTLLDCQKNNSIYTACAVALGQEPVTLLSSSYNQTDIDSLAFVLAPTGNPYFDQIGDFNQQPRVTIKMVVSYPSNQVFERVTHYLQTSISSRVYKR